MNAYYAYNMRRSGLQERAQIAREARAYWSHRKAISRLRSEYGWRDVA